MLRPVCLGVFADRRNKEAGRCDESKQLKTISDTKDTGYLL
jgi:hypothetical protein